MTQSDLIARNDKGLAELHPGIRAKVAAVLTDLQGHGFRPRIQQAHRTAAEQQRHLQNGVSRVTWSFHQATARDGTPEALAADLVDDDDPRQEATDSRRFFLQLASSAWAHGLATGTLWGLKPQQKSATIAAIVARDWDARVALGWDAGHIEVRGITLSEARQGKRPSIPPG